MSSSQLQSCNILDGLTNPILNLSGSEKSSVGGTRVVVIPGSANVMIKGHVGGQINWKYLSGVSNDKNDSSDARNGGQSRQTCALDCNEHK